MDGSLPRVAATPTRAINFTLEIDRDAVTPFGGRVGFIAEIVGRRAERMPTLLLILLDVSPSMAWEGKIEKAKEGVKQILNMLKPRDHAALITFCRKAKLVASTLFGDSLEVVREAIDSVKLCPFTNIGAALELALDLVEEINRRFGVRYSYRAILVTDGLPTWGPRKVEQFKRYTERAQKLGVPIIAIGIGKEYNEKLLYTLASETGGVFEHVSTPEEIRKVIEEYGARGVKVVAKNLTIEMELPTYVDLEVYGARFDRKGSKAFIYVGDVSENEKVSVGGMFIVFPSDKDLRVGRNVEIARVRAVYYDPEGGERRTAWIDVRLRVVGSESEVVIDDLVAAKVNTLGVAQKIAGAIIEGKIEEAIEATMRLAEETIRIGDMTLHAETLRVKELLEAGAEEATKRALSLVSKIVKRGEEEGSGAVEGGEEK